MNGPCVLALLLLAMFSVSEAARKNLSGNFSHAPKDGAKCKWVEGGGGTGSGPRRFKVNCTVKNGKNYNCEYKGNPHDCAAYNKGNQPAYYACLANAAADNAATGCSHDTLICEEKPKFKNCGDVKFKKCN